MIGDILSNQSYVLGLLGIFQMTVEDWLPVKVRRAAIDRELKTNETLFRLGSKAVGMYEVISGRVRLCRVDSTGREIVLHVAGPGETLAEASLYSAEYHCDAVANTDATVRFFPKRELLAAFEMNPKTAQAFTKMLAHQVMRLRTSIEQRNIRSARERVRHFLALNVGPDSRTVRLRGTLKDLAAEIGLTHEALYRTLAALEVSGEIRRKGRIIVLSKRI
jgi:CRP-like cAMP-binding protein